MSFGIYLVVDGDLKEDIFSKVPNKPSIYRGKDAAQTFMSHLIPTKHTDGNI